MSTNRPLLRVVLTDFGKSENADWPSDRVGDVIGVLVRWDGQTHYQQLHPDELKIVKPPRKSLSI